MTQHDTVLGILSEWHTCQSHKGGDYDRAREAAHCKEALDESGGAWGWVRSKCADLSMRAVQQLGTQEPPRNLPGTSQEPPRNLVGTSQEPPRNLPGSSQEPSSNLPATSSRISRYSCWTSICSISSGVLPVIPSPSGKGARWSTSQLRQGATTQRFCCMLWLADSVGIPEFTYLVDEMHGHLAGKINKGHP